MSSAGSHIYPWMTKVFGNPTKALAHLDKRRVEILKALPETASVDDISQDIVDEWMSLLVARSDALREILIDDNSAYLLHQASGILSTMQQLKKLMDIENWSSFSELHGALQRFMSSHSTSFSSMADKEPSSLHEEKWLQNSYMEEAVSGRMMSRSANLAHSDSSPPLQEAGDAVLLAEWKPNAVSTPLQKSKTANGVKGSEADGDVDLLDKSKNFPTEQQPSTPPDISHKEPDCKKRLDQEFGLEDSPCISFIRETHVDNGTPLNKSMEKSQRSFSCPHDLSEISSVIDLPSRCDTGMGSRLSFLGSSNSMCSVQVLSQRLMKNSWPKPSGMQMVVENVIPEKADHNDSVD